jgi:CelD/BcsL family acetyltransferase involved in cellulose biosynthesis
VQLEEIATADGLEALRPEWDALASRCPEASPFLQPEWLLPWWRRLGGGRLLVLGLRDDGRLAALAPFFIYDAGGRRRLALLGSGISDELDLLAEPGCAATAAARVLEHLSSIAGAWDECRLDDLPPSSALLTAPCRLPRAASECGGCHVLSLPGTPEAFSAALRPHQRRNLRRAQRLLEARGPLRYERASENGVLFALEALFGLHAARWRQRGEPGVLDAPALQAFHREAASGLAAAGQLRLRTLRLGERVAAVLYGLRRGARAFAYLGGFDPELAQGSPGTLLTGWAIADSIAEGASSYDFLRGDEPHKSTWGAERVPRLRLSLSR